MAAAGAGIITAVTATGAEITASQPPGLIFLKPLTAKATAAHVYLRCGRARLVYRKLPAAPFIR